ncbi:MAG: phosphate acetyltransferase [Acetobacteraceae bacterium]
MKALDALIDRARAHPRHIVLAEGEDSRVVAGAVRAVQDGIAKVTLLGNTTRVRELLQEQGAGNMPLMVVDPATSPDLDRFAAEYYELRRHKGMDRDTAGETIRQATCYADMMVRLGQADGSVAGATHTTADTVRAALQVIGPDRRYSLVSSFFIMMLCEPYHEHKGALVFADCGLVVDPTAEELAQIAIASADSAHALLDMEPRVAMLSFSTGGSAHHRLVDKVVSATDLARQLRPGLVVEGDLQFDAAIVPEISLRKAPGSRIEGHANVLIFPNLEAGNIGYKMVERLGKAKAIGPILQGLAAPANDLSRGCSAEDVFYMIAVTVAQAEASVLADALVTRG